MAIARFEDLEVWQVSHALTLAIFKTVRAFPDDERFCLSIQMRRAAMSIPANIAEGFGRHGRKDQHRFFNYSRGSAEELKYYLILAHDLGYLKDPKSLRELLESVCRMLHRLLVPRALPRP